MESILGSPVFFMLLIFIVFWLFIIRPKQKQLSKENEFRKNLKKGDKVITAGGIHGKIVGIKESTVLLEIEGGNKIKVNKTAILSYKE